MVAAASATVAAYIHAVRPTRTDAGWSAMVAMAVEGLVPRLGRVRRRSSVVLRRRRRSAVVLLRVRWRRSSVLLLLLFRRGLLLGRLPSAATLPSGWTVVAQIAITRRQHGVVLGEAERRQHRWAPATAVSPIATTVGSDGHAAREGILTLYLPRGERYWHRTSASTSLIPPVNSPVLRTGSHPRRWWRSSSSEGCYGRRT